MGFFDFLKGKPAQGNKQPLVAQNKVTPMPAETNSAFQAVGLPVETAAERQARIEKLAILTVEAMLAVGETVRLAVQPGGQGTAWEIRQEEFAAELFAAELFGKGLQKMLNAKEFSGLARLHNFESPDVASFYCVVNADLANQWAVEGKIEMHEILFGSGRHGAPSKSAIEAKAQALRETPASLDQAGSVFAAEQGCELTLDVKTTLMRAIRNAALQTPEGISVRKNDRALSAWTQNIADQVAGYGPSLKFAEEHNARAETQSAGLHRDKINAGFNGAARKAEMEAALANMSLAEYLIAKTPVSQEEKAAQAERAAARDHAMNAVRKQMAEEQQAREIA